MVVVNFENENSPLAYIVLGIDEHEHDQVLAVFNSYSKARNYCAETMQDNEFFDLWIEKHPIL